MPQPETPTQHPRAILIALMFHRICLALYVHLVNRFHILIFDGWSCQRKFVFFWRWLNKAARLTTVRLAARSSCRVAATFDLGTFAATPRKKRRNPPKDKGARQGGVVDRTIKTEFQRANQKRLLRSEEHTSELQSLRHLVCRLLL